MADSRYGFGPVFIDVDEWRDHPRRHRYVHGGFEGTETRFSFYFPPKELYRGRMIQHLEGGMGGHEDTIVSATYAAIGMTGAWLFDFAFEELGAHMVESNQGHFPRPGDGFATDVQNFGASGESARASWKVAEAMYGKAPHHSYVWGVSGGGGRTMSCIEYEPEVWDGAVPHMCYSGSIHGAWSAEGYWWLTARHKLAEVVDAPAPGGSGDPFPPLGVEEREGLAAVLRHGYPRAAVSQLWQFAPWVWRLMASAAEEPYYRDFWEQPGYKGHDNRAELQKHILDFDAKVATVLKVSELGVPSISGSRMASAGAVSDNQSGITLDVDLPDNTLLYGAWVTFKTGKAKGRVVQCSQVEGRLLLTSVESNAELFDDVAPGDEVHIDNHAFIAWTHQWMHQLDLPATGELPLEWRGLEAWMVDGRAVYPQLPTPDVANGEPPGGHHGVFKGKVIHINTTHDSMVWPNGAVAWTRKIEKAQGEGRRERYRLWWGENAPHGAPQFLPMVTARKDPKAWIAEMVSYNGLTCQALREVVRWAEDGVEPSPGAKHHFTKDGGVVLPDTAEQRGGVQPLAWVRANGAVKAEVKVGESVRLEGVAQQPPGMGSVVWTEWDFEGKGACDRHDAVDTDAERVVQEARHVFDKPGTYFVGFRVAGHREGVKGTGLPIENVARARVVVTA